MTMAPSGMSAAASAAGRTSGDMLSQPRLDLRSTGRCGRHRERAIAGRQRPDTVLAGRRGLRPRRDGGVEQAERALVEVLAVDRQLLLAGRRAQRGRRRSASGSSHRCRSASPRCRGPRSRSRRAGGEGVVELGEQAGAEADSTPMTPSSSPPGAMPALCVSAVTSTGSSSEDEAQRVGVVHGDVEHHATAGAGSGEAPALQVRRQIDGVEDARRERLADPPGLDRLAHRAMRAGVAQVMVGSQDDAGRRGRPRPLSRASAIVRASGFSHRTCLPAWAAASVCSWCSSLVVET